MGLYGPKIVWMLQGYYAADFWKTNPAETDCTTEEMERAVEGSFLIRNLNINPVEKKGLANLTCKK